MEEPSSALWTSESRLESQRHLLGAPDARVRNLNKWQPWRHGPIKAEEIFTVGVIWWKVEGGRGRGGGGGKTRWKVASRHPIKADAAR